MRTVLFLQGHPSRFAGLVANEVERLGGRALKINLSAGDALFWRGPRAISYRGKLADWPEFLRTFARREGVTDIVYYADRLPYHRAANQVARELGIRASTYEFGYLRPDWITLERGGMSAFSHLPNDPDRLARVAAAVPPPDTTERYRYTFGSEATNEVIYNVASVLGFFLYPHFKADRYYHPVADYLSYIPQLLTGRRDARQADRITSRLIAEKTKFFLLPMQMQNDYQLRANSPYRHQRDALEEVIGSFARVASGETQLVIKVHPLDNGLERWPRVINRITREHGVGDRVHLIRGGDLKSLIGAARGTIVINSTVGVHALRHDCPVKVLGVAVYDIRGLTHRDPLDTFWTAPTKPDPKVRDDFVRATAATIHVKGNFFTADGRAAAVPEMARRLVEGRVNAHGAFVDPPPRLSRALAMGIPFDLHEAAVAAGAAPPRGRGRIAATGSRGGDRRSLACSGWQTLARGMPKPSPRIILFLQGPLSPLYGRLADRLASFIHRGCWFDSVDGDEAVGFA